jgi:cbb3-type cytochrome oxidase cytochrome c subunit
VRRIGPDLAHIGNRRDPVFIYNFLLDPDSVADGARHPADGFLSEDELGSLTAFLIETK